MKQLIPIFFVLFAVQSQAQHLKLTYQAWQEIEWSAEQKEKFLEAFHDKVEGERQMRQNTHSEPVIYELYADENTDYTLQKFIPKIRNDQDEDAAQITVAPSGFGDLFKRRKDDFVYQKFNVYSKKVLSKDSLIYLNSGQLKLSDDILGHRSFVDEIETKMGKVKYWIIKDLTAHVGPWKFASDQGLIAKLEIQHQYFDGKIFFDLIEIESLKKLKINDFPNTKNAVEPDVVNQMYEEANKKMNEMHNDSSIVEE